MVWVDAVHIAIGEVRESRKRKASGPHFLIQFPVDSVVAS